MFSESSTGYAQTRVGNLGRILGCGVGIAYFAEVGSGLEAFEYAIESDPNYQLLKKHEQKIFRVAFASGEESVVKVLHVDEQHEDFIYDLLSTNLERDHYRAKSDAVYVARFADLVSARLEG